MTTYKVLKEVRYQGNGDVKVFQKGIQITSKDLLNEKQEKGFIKDGFLEEVKKKEKKDKG